MDAAGTSGSRGTGDRGVDARGGGTGALGTCGDRRVVGAVVEGDSGVADGVATGSGDAGCVVSGRAGSTTVVEGTVGGGGGADAVRWAAERPGGAGEKIATMTHSPTKPSATAMPA